MRSYARFSGEGCGTMSVKVREGGGVEGIRNHDDWCSAAIKPCLLSHNVFNTHSNPCRPFSAFLSNISSDQRSKRSCSGRHPTIRA